MADGRDLYKILQVDPEADPDVIRAAYRRLAQKYHPDRAGDSEAVAEKMIALNAAWEVIRDPARRAAYDRERATARARAAPTGTGRAARTGGGHGTAGRPARRSDAGWPENGEESPGYGRTGEPVSGDWTSGRSSAGGGYDPSMRAPDGYGAAGPPPGKPSGSVLNFGRYAGWSLGEVARVDLEFLEWLERSPIGRQYREELDDLLRRSGRRRTGGDDTDRRGLFRR